EPHLEVLSPEEEPLDAVLEYIWAFPHGEGEFVTVVIPELFRKQSLLAMLRRSTFSLKVGLLREPGVVVTDVPNLAGSEGESAEPSRTTCVIPVSRVDAASVRAVIYARSLGLPD